MPISGYSRFRGFDQRLEGDSEGIHCGSDLITFSEEFVRERSPGVAARPNKQTAIYHLVLTLCQSQPERRKLCNAADEISSRRPGFIELVSRPIVKRCKTRRREQFVRDETFSDGSSGGMTDAKLASGLSRTKKIFPTNFRTFSRSLARAVAVCENAFAAGDIHG